MNRLIMELGRLDDQIWLDPLSNFVKNLLDWMKLNSSSSVRGGLEPPVGCQ